MRLSRAGVLRILEKPGAERLVDAALVVSEHAGDKPHDGIGHRERRKLAAREHIIAQGDAAVGARIDALVHALVMAADEQDAVLVGELLGHRLAKRLARGGEEDGVRRVIGASKLIEGLKERLALHEHALAAAVGRVVNRTMPVMGPVAQVMGRKLKVARLAGPAHDGQGHDGLEHLGKDAEGLDTNGHGSTPRAGCRGGA